MSIISVANIHFETTGTNRVNYTGNNVIRITSNAIQMPVGTTGARPSIEAGLIRYNSDLGLFEGANATAWGSIGGVVDFATANGWANTVATAGNNYTNSVGTAGNNYTNAVGLAGNNYTNSVGAAGNSYATTMATAGNNYTNSVGLAGNNYVNTVVFPVANAATAALANVSGTVYRGDLYFANGNVGIGIASAAPTELYVNGSAAATINVLVDGATVTPIFGGNRGNNNFTLTLGGNRVVANPVNPIAGQSGTIYIIQDSTGSRTLSWGNLWRFQGNTAPTLSTSANAVDMLVYSVRTTANISCQLINNVG
jgi:hypothetical protein